MPLKMVNGVTPCATCPKIPDRVVGPDGNEIAKVPGNYKLLRPHAIEMTDQMRQAWAYDRECQAVGQFPDDPIVRRNAAAIRQAEREAAEYRQSERDRVLLDLVIAIGEKRGGR